MADGMTPMRAADLMAQRHTTNSTAAWQRPTVDTSQSQREQLYSVAKEFEAAFLS